MPVARGQLVVRYSLREYKIPPPPRKSWKSTQKLQFLVDNSDIFFLLGGGEGESEGREGGWIFHRKSQEGGVDPPLAGGGGGARGGRVFEGNWGVGILSRKGIAR